MKKKIITLALVAMLAVGCGATKDEANDKKTEQKIDRLSKEEFIKQFEKEMLEMQKLVSEFTISNAEDAANKINAKIDEMINLKGPEELADMEAKIDDALTRLRDLLEESKTYKKDDIKKITELVKEMSTLITELIETIKEYSK